MSIFGAAIKGFGLLGKGKGKTAVKNTNPPMIKIKPKPKGTTPKNLDNQKKIKVSEKPAISGKETYNYEGLKEVKGSKSMKEKSKPIKLPSRKGPPKRSGTTLSAIKKSNPALYKKYMRNLGKTTSKPSSFPKRRLTLGGIPTSKKIIGAGVILAGADIATGGKSMTNKKKKLSEAIKEKKK